MILEVDADSPTPPYEQIRAQVALMASTGVLEVGGRLPSIRQLAADLGLAPGTVARAYRELEAAGVIVTRVGRGTTIAALPYPESRMTQHNGLLEAARDYVAAAQRLGVSRDQVVAALQTQLSTLGLP